MQERNIKILEIPSELGAGTRGASLGPMSVRLADIARGGDIYGKFPFETLYGKSKALSNPPEFLMAKYLKQIYKTIKKNCESLEFELEEGHFPLVMSGDHSNALSAISALKNYYPEKKIGVIWIDAHADLHSPYTSPSGNVHGMPLGAALGEGYKSKVIHELPEEVEEYWTLMTKIGTRNISPKVDPADLIFIDIRDLEEQEWADIDDNKIKFFVPARLHNKEMSEIGKYALDYLDHCDMIYCSFDVDSMDPEVSKGTGTSVENGLSLQQAQELLSTIWASDKLKILEITEVNPLLDTENKMAKAVLQILDKLLK